MGEIEVIELFLSLALSDVVETCPTAVQQYVENEASQPIASAEQVFISSLIDEIENLHFDGDVPDNAWDYFQWRRQSADNETIACLLGLVAQEQYLRLWFRLAQTPGHAESATQEQLRAASGILGQIDERNRIWLSERIEQSGWFTISEHGEDADLAAFLIVQHADQDVQFQRNMLNQLEPLAESGDTDSGRYAMLIDRVAVNSGELQVYGSQGYCSGPMEWQARPYEGTQEELDQRRQNVGLPDHQVYVDRISRNCSAREY